MQEVHNECVKTEKENLNDSTERKQVKCKVLVRGYKSWFWIMLCLITLACLVKSETNPYGVNGYNRSTDMSSAKRRNLLLQKKTWKIITYFNMTTVDTH